MHDPTPVLREQNAAERILINKENGDILVLIPKLGKDQALSHEGLEEYLEPLIEELERDLSVIDLNDEAAPHNTIHNFGKRGG